MRDTRYAIWLRLIGTVKGPDSTDGLLDAYRDEILRHAVRIQREWLVSYGYDPDCVCEGCGWCLAQEFINLIDPDYGRENDG